VDIPVMNVVSTPTDPDDATTSIKVETGVAVVTIPVIL
jgi:hypothetical protein